MGGALLLTKSRSGTSPILSSIIGNCMGQNSSSPHQLTQEDCDSETCIQSECDATTPASISFDPSQSYMVSYGVDVQTNPKFLANMSLSSIAVRDATKIRDILVQTGIIPASNAHLYAASSNLESCKISGIKRSFQECVRKVGPNGLFVFHFSGHGVEHNIHRKKVWTLAPVDFNYKQDTLLTADVFGRWFREAECKAKHILFFLDCCHAGGIATKLSRFSNLPVKGTLFVLSACTANEETLVIGALKHSIFTYFLSQAILKLCGKTPGEIPLKAIFSECHACSKAFSSLMIMYDDASEDITIKRMQPQMAVITPQSLRVESDGRINRFQYAMELHDRSKPSLTLEDKTIAHINSWVSPDGPLCELDKRSLLLDGRVLDAAICSMMYSVATIELSCDKTHERVRNPNLSIIAFLQVAAALDTIREDLEVSEKTFFMAWMFYREVLKSNGVNVYQFFKLYRKLSKDSSFYDPGQRVRTRTYVPSYKPVSEGAASRRRVSLCMIIIISSLINSLAPRYHTGSNVQFYGGLCSK